MDRHNRGTRRNRACVLSSVIIRLIIHVSSIMPECHLKFRYTSRQIIPMSHLLSSSNLRVFIPMSILHLVQFALISFRFVFLGHSVTFKVDCLSSPQDKWSAVYSVQTILLSLQSLLGG